MNILAPCCVPKDIACELEPCAWRIMKIRIAPKMISGRKLKSSPKMLPNWLGPLTVTSTAPSPDPTGTPLSRSSSSMELALSLRERTGSCSLRRSTIRRSPVTSMRSTLPACAWTITWESATSREPLSGRKSITTASTIATRIRR